MLFGTDLTTALEAFKISRDIMVPGIYAQMRI